MQTNQIAGVKVVGISAGDLMDYSDRLEELAGGQDQPEVREAFEKHCFPGRTHDPAS